MTRKMFDLSSLAIPGNPKYKNYRAVMFEIEMSMPEFHSEQLVDRTHTNTFYVEDNQFDRMFITTLSPEPLSEVNTETIDEIPITFKRVKLSEIQTHQFPFSVVQGTAVLKHEETRVQGYVLVPDQTEIYVKTYQVTELEAFMLRLKGVQVFEADTAGDAT